MYTDYSHTDVLKAPPEFKLNQNKEGKKLQKIARAESLTQQRRCVSWQEALFGLQEQHGVGEESLGRTKNSTTELLSFLPNLQFTTGTFLCEQNTS